MDRDIVWQGERASLTALSLFELIFNEAVSNELINAFQELIGHGEGWEKKAVLISSYTTVSPIVWFHTKSVFGLHSVCVSY